MAIPSDILRNARDLRTAQTDAENLLWRLLRDRRLVGHKFRRQHPVDRYILDFYCQKANLAVELDGGGHADPEQAEYDRERTRYLEGAGIRVVRFWNLEVLQETEAVLERIAGLLESSQASPSPGLRPPSPQGEG